MFHRVATTYFPEFMNEWIPHEIKVENIREN